VFLLEGAEADVRGWQGRLAIHRGCALEIADPSSVSATSANDRLWHFCDIAPCPSWVRDAPDNGHSRPVDAL